MSDLYVTDLFVYPVKSCAPLRVSRAWVGEQGLEMDRRFMVVDPAGQFITARRYPLLTHLQATPLTNGLVLAAASMPSLRLETRHFPDEWIDVEVWKQGVKAQACGQQADDWLSRFLGTPCQLVYFAHTSERAVKDSTTDQVAFADGYPLLLTSESSLNWIQERCHVAIDRQQFRANIIVNGELPFAEDGWLDITIGEVQLRVHSPCERCKLITLPPGQKTFDSTQEPLRTLLQHRRWSEGGAIFGQNLLVRQPGVIAEGMAVKVLARKEPALCV